MFKKVKILFVDDEHPNLNAFTAHFRRNTNYEIYTSRTCQEALEILKLIPIHVLIVDQKMPEMTGLEFLNQAELTDPEPVKIVVTAHRDIEPLQKAFYEGKIFKYHGKPWDFDDLEKSIDEAAKVYRKKTP